MPADNSGKRPTGAVDIDPRFAAALKKAEKQPSDDKAWDELEELTAELQRPESVAALFLKVLKSSAGAELCSTLGKRAVRFHEEWFGDDQAALLALLETLLGLDPGQDWAFERLTLLLSVAQRWDDLLGFYDRTLADLKDGPRRRKLLQEAAGVAKDFLGKMDRAIGYLDELFRAKPGDPHVSSALERLLEREEKWADLARVWKVRLEYVTGDEAHDLRGRLATMRLEELDDAEGAVAEARILLKEKGDDGVACHVLERVLALSNASADTRRTALELLRAQHEKQGRKDRLVSVLQTANEFASGNEKLGLLREAAERLQSQGDTAAAMAKLVELLELAPEDASVRTRLRHLAELSDAHATYVQGLSRAAIATRNGQLRGALLIEAGRVEEDVRGDHAQAISFFQRAANDEEADPARRLTALRRLASLLDRDDTAALRLAVLERLAALTPEAAEKRTVLGLAGRLGARSGEIDRAVAAWQARLAQDDADREALDALAGLLADAGRHPMLVEVLRRRAEVDKRDLEKRADLVRVARLSADELRNLPGAIDTWVEIQQRFGEDAESTAALRELFGTEERWPELAALLSRTGERDRARLAELYCRLGDLFRKHLGKPAQAVKAYGFALETDASFAAARAGLHALLDDPECRRPAIDALVHSYTLAHELVPLVELTERRLDLAADDAGRARLLIEMAEICEREGGDHKSALTYLCRALTLSPENARIESEIFRLAPTVDGWESAARALHEAGTHLPKQSPRVVHLHIQEGTVLEEKLHDLPAALASFEAAHKLAPDRAAAKTGCVRVAAAIGKWDQAAAAVLSAPIAAEVVTSELLPIYEQAAKQAAAQAATSANETWLAAAQALSAVLAKRKSVPRTLARDLETTIAGWHEAQGGSEGPALAEAALVRAMKYDRHHAATLGRLADLQRKRPGRPLYETLTRLSELEPTNLDSGMEALALAHGGLAERQLALKTGLGLLERASHMLRTELPASGTTGPGVALERALDTVVTLLLASGERTDAARAVAALGDATSLPLPVDTVRALRRRAAKIALETLADRARARELYRQIVEDHVDEPGTSREAIRTLATLYEEADLLSEALALRRRELALGLPVPERLALRLEMARVAGLIEDRSPRVTTLLANLEEAPGDPATVDALAQILVARNKERDLADVLTEQAERLEKTSDGARAAQLWMRVALLAEGPLADSGRAVAAYERVANLAPTAEAFDALARLSTERGEPMAAAGWLEQRLQGALGDARVDVALRLGKAYLEGGQRHRAIGCLERALAEAPTAHALRSLLIEIYRKAEAWEPLARTLADGGTSGVDPDVISAYAKEAATLYQERLGRPELAVPVLERAVELLPKDRWLRTNLAEGLRVAGRHAEARRLLEGLLEEMGRRRSKERAAIHHQLALVARADKDFPTAIENLEQATAIDVGGMDVLVDLAETAEQAQDLDRAEKAYQGILVLARRGDPESQRLSASETLLRLQKVAQAGGDTAAATECFDSATAAALQSPAEAARMQKALLARGDVDLALDLVEKRRAAAANAAEEAGVLAERAEMFESLGRNDEAIAAAAAAIEKAPDANRGHEIARRIARAAATPQKYLLVVTTVLDQMRRRDDGPRVCDLLLRAGEAAETDLKDFKQAAAFYSRAEQTGARTLDVLEAIARAGSRTGDKAEEGRALKQLSRMAADAETPDERNEIAFRLAALQLRSADTRVSGLETLAAVLEKKPDFARALEIVRAAEVPEEELPRVMPLYARVARSSGDDRMLLDYLERRAAAKDVTQEEVSEGVELALALGRSDRASVLLERAVELAQARGAPREAAWALLDLAQRKKSEGDYAAAFKWLEEASRASDSPRIPALLRELAREVAQKPGGSELAAEAFESLRRRNPSEREIWLPLMENYARLGAGAKLGALVIDTVGKLVDRNDRTLLRITWARFLLDSHGDEAEATSALRDILLDEPGHPEALSRLADLHERRGDVAEALSLLSDSLREAEARGDDAWRSATAKRLGELLKRADPVQAKQVYRQTLAGTVADPALRRELQQSLLDLLDEDEFEEKATLAEAMLADETGPAAADRALALADVRRELGDEAGERRALQIGLGRAPDHPILFERLSELLEDKGDAGGLEALLEAEADRLTGKDPARAALLLRQIAQTHRHKMQDPAGAAKLLRKAADLAPANADEVRELSGCLRDAGDLPGAIAAVGETLASAAPRSDEDRVDLLRLSAELHIQNGDEWGAVGDLEKALALAGIAAADPLVDALYAAAQRSARDEDLAGQRKAMLRLSALFAEKGDGNRGQKLLFDWVDEHPEDMAALGALSERFESEQDWERVIEIGLRMVSGESGEAKIDAGLGLAHAYEQVGRAAEAVPVLEALLASFPGQPAVLNILSELYVAAGDSRKVAMLKIQQADSMNNEEERFSTLTDGADMLLQCGEPESAILAINKAFALRPDDRTVQRLLADALLASGQFDQAANVLDQLIGDGRGIEPGELCALYHRLSRAAGGMGDTNEQLQALRKGMEADRKNGHVAAELAELAESSGDDDLALKALRAITLHVTDGPMTKGMAFYRQARIAHKNNDRQRALIFAKRALQEEPGLPEAQQLLESVR